MAEVPVASELFSEPKQRNNQGISLVEINTLRRSTGIQSQLQRWSVALGTVEEQGMKQGI